MRTCRHCGCYLPDGVTVCLACGTYQGKRLPASTHTDPDLIETCALGDVLVELRASPVIEGISIFDNNGCSIRGCSACAYMDHGYCGYKNR